MAEKAKCELCYKTTYGQECDEMLICASASSGVMDAALLRLPKNTFLALVKTLSSAAIPYLAMLS